MKHGSLFSGIGGFDLAAEWMGWENVFHCEIDEFPRKILNYYWPNSISYHDIKTTDFSVHRGQIDILTGGFPCQPYSAAGKRLGKEDDRHLWPFMLEAIRSIQPRWVVGENVRGLVNWSDGLVFEEVQVDLEAEGYEVQAFILPAAGIGAPHRRDRVWFVAYANHGYDGRNTGKNEGESGEERLSEWDEVRKSTESGEVFGDVADSKNIRWDCGKCEHREDFNKNREWVCKCRQERSKMGAITQRFSEESDVADSSQQRCDNGCDNRGERLIQNNINRNASESESKRSGWKCGACKAGQIGDVANTYSNGGQESSGNMGQKSRKESEEEREATNRIDNYGQKGDVADSDNKLRKWRYKYSKKGWEVERKPVESLGCNKQRENNSGENGVELHDAYADSIRQSREKYRQEQSRWTSEKSFSSYWENFPTQSPICGGDDEFPPELDGITFPKWRNGSIKGYGNAVVPALVYEIFKSIEEYESLK